MSWKKLLALGALIGMAFQLLAAPVQVADGNSAEVSESEGEEDTPVVAEQMERPISNGQDTPWTPPNYAGQERALGYSPDAFAVPAGMEDRVAFWIDIYTKLNTDQGILHDSKYVSLIYETIDFADLNQDLSLTPRQKEKKRRNRVTDAKKKVELRLERLNKLHDADGLDAEDLRYWNLFSSVSEPNKFREAARRGRLRFQLGQRDRFMEGIYQSGRHLREMEEIYRREGLPLELTRLPFVESSFNLKARSKVGASGIWQFMKSTAKAYMRMDNSCDERNDPLRATVAAARKLRNNYEMLKTWPLAVTGYNHGPSGVARLVRKYKTTNLAELTDVRKGRFGFASANFFASFLAAVHVEQSADRYFGPLKRMAELRGVEFRLTRPLPAPQLVNFFDGDLNLAQTFNPHVRSTVWPKGVILARNLIRVPLTKAEQVEAQLNLATNSPLLSDSRPDSAVLVPVDPKSVKAKKPRESHKKSRVAKDTKDTKDTKDIKENKESVVASASPLEAAPNPGPGSASSSAPSAAVSLSTDEPTPKKAGKSYLVQKGDSLEAVAQKLGVSEESLFDLNNVPNPKELIEGSTLQLPGN